MKRVSVPLALAVALLAAGVGLVDAQQFSPEERRILAEHEPVRHPRTQNRHGRTYIGGTAFRVIPRPLDEVWRAVNDTRAMCQMLPQCVGHRVVARRAQQWVMRFTHEYGPIRASYHVRIEPDARERELAFRLDRTRPNDVREAWGFLDLAPYRGRADETLVTWGVMADPGSQIMGALIGGMVQASLLRVPDEMFDYLVGPARDRYR